MQTSASRWMWMVSIAVGLFLVPSTVTAADPDAPACEVNPEDDCDIERFRSLSTGSKGQSFTVNGFDFGTINSCGNNFDIQDQTNLLRTVKLATATSIITLPNTREYVTLLLENFSGTPRVNILAYGGGTLVDEETRDLTATDGAEAVKLGGREKAIDTIYIHNIEQNACGLRCTGRINLAEIRACDVKFNK